MWLRVPFKYKIIEILDGVDVLIIHLFHAHFERPSSTQSRDLIMTGLICHTPATTSISTNAPLGKVFTATADLAGYGSAKNSA